MADVATNGRTIPTRPIPEVRHGAPGSNSSSPQVCIFGRGGWGKTSLLGSMPGRGVIVETPKSEGGTGDDVLSKKADRIEVVYATSWQGILDAFDWIQWSPDARRFQWIGFDTITGAKQLAIERVIQDRPDTIKLDPHKITQPEWGKIGQMVSDVVMKYGSLQRVDRSTGKVLDDKPLPIFWTAQEKRFTGEDDEGTKYTFVGPDTTPSSLATLLPTLMLCGRITAFPSETGSGYDRRLRIGPHPMYLTKTRSVDENIVIPRQIRVGTPIKTELYDVIQYLRGKLPIESLDVIVDDIMTVGEIDVLEEIMSADTEGGDGEPSNVGDLVEVLAG